MASFVLTKDNVYWSATTDSHDEILSEFGLKDTGLAGKIEILRVEISPENDNYLATRNDWKYRVDQDLLPDWAEKEKDEERTRSALESWWKACVVGVGQEIDKLEGTDFRKICFGSVGEMRESSQVGEMRGSSQVGAMWESSQVGVMRGSSQVGVMRESAQVGEMWESSQVGVMWGSANVGVMRGSSQVGEMRGSSQVGVMWESSQVRAMRESAQVRVMLGSAQVTTYAVITPKMEDQTVVIDRSGDKVKTIFGPGALGPWAQ